MTGDSRVASLVGRAAELAESLRPAGDERDTHIAERLSNSVIRPLSHTVEAGNAALKESTQVDEAADSVVQGLDLELWGLAREATQMRIEVPQLLELVEAAAALQDLALTTGDESAAAQRFAELALMQGSLTPQIQVMPNGPYLVTNPHRLIDWLGVPAQLRPQMALCRCGGSSVKPLCDGAHARNGFIDAKDPNRVKDRRDTYQGQQITIFDNRGTCQHSGLCSDRLATAFRVNQEPFVAPSGGRMDEIIRAVRDCPSGALSYAIDGVEARGEVDHNGSREQAIEVTRDGPYRISGGIPLVGADAVEPVRNLGASREHYALCRCGHSENKPFCSGMHWHVQFRDPVPDPGRTPTVFEWAGGFTALLRLTRLFYEKFVPSDPLLSPLFANMGVDHPERVAAWLGEVFGGPNRYSKAYGGYTRMLSQHVRKELTEEHRARWVALLLAAAREAGLPNDPEFRSAFQSYIEWASRLAVENSQKNSRPPENMPMPHWTWMTAAGPPGSRSSAPAPQPTEEAIEMKLPGPDDAVGFAAHIKPMFRQADRQSMSWAFDLWSHQDVSAHADAILKRLRAGTMPCDGAWSSRWVDVFERWIRDGKPA